MKAVVFVDVQKDFIDGALKNEKAIEVTPKIVEFAKECVKNGYKLYATRDTHEVSKFSINAATLEKTPTSGYLATLEGKKLPVEHCVEGTDGWMIDNRLMEVLDGKCTFINKPTFGSFDLAEIIEEDIGSGHILANLTVDKRFDELYNPLEEIVICGFCTDICVVSNALILRAKFPNTKISVKGFLCAGTTEENHEAAIKTMKSCQIDFI